jgi:hypothetical protein
MTFFDAQLARYKILKIEPVGPLTGATVHGVDLAHVSDEALRAELRRALADFQVLFFSDPDARATTGARPRLWRPRQGQGVLCVCPGRAQLRSSRRRPTRRATAPINGGVVIG